MLKSAIIAVGLSVVFTALWTIYEALSYRTGEPDSLNRITIKPGPMSWLMGLLCCIFFALFGTMTANSIIAKDDMVFWLSLGPPLTLLMAFAAYVISWTRLRVSNAYVEHRGIKGWTQFEWDNVIGLRHHSVLGHRLHVAGRRPLPVWIYGQGTLEVRELFALYEKTFET